MIVSHIPREFQISNSAKKLAQINFPLSSYSEKLRPAFCGSYTLSDVMLTGIFNQVKIQKSWNQPPGS